MPRRVPLVHVLNTAFLQTFVSRVEICCLEEHKYPVGKKKKKKFLIEFLMKRNQNSTNQCHQANFGKFSSCFV